MFKNFTAGSAEQDLFQIRANARKAVTIVVLGATTLCAAGATTVAYTEKHISAYFERHCSSWEILFKNDRERAVDAIDCALTYGDFKGAEYYTDGITDDPELWQQVERAVDYVEAAAALGEVLGDRTYAHYDVVRSISPIKYVDEPAIRGKYVQIIDDMTLRGAAYVRAEQTALLQDAAAVADSL